MLPFRPGEDWRKALLSCDITHHLLKPSGLDLVVKKNILPMDTRLPRSSVMCIEQEKVTIMHIVIKEVKWAVNERNQSCMYM